MTLYKSAQGINISCVSEYVVVGGRPLSVGDRHSSGGSEIILSRTAMMAGARRRILLY